MLSIKDVNHNDMKKKELLDDKIDDYVKYFYNNNQFREGKIIEILPHGTIIIKNILNYTHDRVLKPSLVLNISMLERKLMNNLINTSIKDFNNTKEIELHDKINKLTKYTYILAGISLTSLLYVFKQIVI